MLRTNKVLFHSKTLIKPKDCSERYTKNGSGLLDLGQKNTTSHYRHADSDKDGIPGTSRSVICGVILALEITGTADSSQILLGLRTQMTCVIIINHRRKPGIRSPVRRGL